MMSNKTLRQVIVYGAAIFLLPMLINDDFLLNRFARYLVLAMVSMALALSWGYAGILNLGQAMSFGLGSYCMAMALKLRTIPVHTGSEGLPDFMVWNNVEALPWFWKPFYSMPFAIAAGILVPVIVSAILAWFMFRGRVTGVYVAIITLATLVVVNLVIIDQQWATGGFNGITDLAYSATTYYLIAICLTVCLFLALAIAKSKAGLILQAIRDQESRVRFFGYDVALFKTMVFCVSAGIAGLAGMLYTIVMEFASPTFLGVQISLSIVVWCAVGGRQSLVGALLGAILVAGMQGALSESEVFLDTWTLVMGALFVLVVLFLPNGIASLGEKLLEKAGFLRRRTAQKAPGNPPKTGSKRMAATKLVEGQ
jgi:urea transport system permease protein